MPSFEPDIERLLRLFLARTDDHAVICIGADRRVIAWLGAGEQILGYKSEEIVGQPASIIFPAEDREKGDRLPHRRAAGRRAARAQGPGHHLAPDGRLDASGVRPDGSIPRATAGKLKLDLARTDLRSVLNEAVAGMRAPAQAKGVRLVSLLPPASLDVMLDAERFQRVVLNLLGNAIKYTPSGGTAWVKATKEGREVLFAVEDTGIGIAPEVLPRIFDLFTQESQAADMVPGGLGIGLTIVKDLVELHGGSVQARSAGAGKGAEFTVRLLAAGQE